LSNAKTDHSLIGPPVIDNPAATSGATPYALIERRFSPLTLVDDANLYEYINWRGISARMYEKEKQSSVYALLLFILSDACRT
jgi:hypothetical protein